MGGSHTWPRWWPQTFWCIAFRSMVFNETHTLNHMSSVKVGLKHIFVKSEVQNQWFLALSTSTFVTFNPFPFCCWLWSLRRSVRTAAAKLVEFQPKDVDAFGHAFVAWSRHPEHQGWFGSTHHFQSFGDALVLRQWSSRQFKVSVGIRDRKKRRKWRSFGKTTSLIGIQRFHELPDTCTLTRPWPRKLKMI